ncbi:uncharacterized protein [Dysidea avara]|uniref:uncharacterized protein isoform X2 n=1 Tax=Dysidea avara TaxID=196820 RepID=UPI003329F892
MRQLRRHSVVNAKCYRHLQAKRYVHVVSKQELSHYCESLKRFNPRAYPFQNVALYKMRGKCDPTILTDKWPNFSCTAILQHWTSTLYFPTRNQRCCRLQLLSDSEEEFGNFLHESKVLQEEAMILGINSVTNKHLDNVAKKILPKWQETPYQLATIL